MQISKCFLAMCVVLCVIEVRGDNDAQTKAREALEKALNSSRPQPPASVQPEAVKPAKAPQAAPTSAPAAAPPALVAPTPVDPEAIAKAREAMHQKMQEGAPLAPVAAAPKSAPPPAQPAVAAQSAPAAVAAPVVQSASPGAEPALIAPTPADPEVIAKAREAMHQKMQEGAPMQPAVAAAPAAAAAAVAATAQPGAEPLVVPPGADANTIAKARDAMRLRMDDVSKQPEPVSSPPVPHQPKPNYAMNGKLNFPPLSGPDMPISADKQQQLQRLLQKYKNDEITPEQYHAERAKILGP